MSICNICDGLEEGYERGGGTKDKQLDDDHDISKIGNSQDGCMLYAIDACKKKLTLAHETLGLCY